MKTFMIVSGIVETAPGLGLLAVPSVCASLLLGTPLDGPVEFVLARLCGAALLSLGIACLLARDEAQAAAFTALLVAMLVYNTAAVTLFIYCAWGPRLVGVFLWPAIVVHAAMAIWCLACLRTRSGNQHA